MFAEIATREPGAITMDTKFAFVQIGEVESDKILFAIRTIGNCQQTALTDLLEVDSREHPGATSATTIPAAKFPLACFR